MKIKQTLLVLFLAWSAGVFASETGAEKPSIDLSVYMGPVISKTKSSSDFDGGSALALQLQYRFHKHFSLELWGEDLIDSEDGEDNRGKYELDLDTTDIGAGVRAILPFDYGIGLHARGGMLYSKLSLTLKEDFFGLKNGGEKTIKDELMGYYAGLGISWEPWKRKPVYFSLDHTWSIKENAFKGSSAPFDLKQRVILLGVGYRF